METLVTNKKRKILRTIYGTLSFSTALFVFQACYGMDRDYGNDIFVDGIVTSSSDGKPITGIKVSVSHDYQYDVTNNEGHFSFYTSRESQFTLKFEDIDASQNGTFVAMDTIIGNIRDTVSVNVSLDAQ